MTEHTKFNVIIPTRERADTLFHCLRTVVDQDYSNLNIIVSDNFSRDGTQDVVRSFSDPRIKYINPGRRLSMSSHWEFALSHVSDGYVTFLGDDDGLVPGALKQLDQIISEYRPDATNAPVIEYNWPENGTGKEWRIIFQSRRETTFVDSKRFLDYLHAGYLTYADGPQIYSGGFARIELIHSARDGSGRFFKSRSPDVYSSIALSCVTSQFLRLSHPIAVAGISRHSTGSSSLNSGSPPGPSETFMKECDIPPHHVFADFSPKSLQLFTYESYLQASHIHHESSERLSKTLSLSVKLSSHRDRMDLIALCHQIAEINSIAWKPTWRESRFCFWVFFVFRELRNEALGLRTRFTTVDGKRYQLDNVYKAACWVGESGKFLSSFRQKWSSFCYKLSRLKTL